MGEPSGDELQGVGQRFQRLVGKIIALEAAEERLDQAIGLRAAARGVTGNQAQTGLQLLEQIRAKLRPIVGEELQTFGLVGLLGKTLEQGFAEEFANIQCRQP